MAYPSKALDDYVLKSDVAALAGGGGGGGGATGVAGPPGPTGAAGPTGIPWAPVESATAPATSNSGTILVTGVTVARVTPLSDITGVLIEPGTVPGQSVAILNESAFTITFANPLVSLVSNGAGCTIAGKTHLPIVWDSFQALWYPLLDGATVAPSNTGLYDIDVYDSGIYDSGTTAGTTAVYGIAIYGTDTYGTVVLLAGYGTATYGTSVYGGSPAPPAPIYGTATYGSSLYGTSPALSVATYGTGTYGGYSYG